MRVIVLLNSLFTGGAEFSTLIFYSWLKKRGHEVRVVVLKEANPSYDPLTFEFDRVTILHGSSVLSRSKSLNKLIHEFKPDVVHSVLFEANLVARLSRIFNSKFVHIESLVNEMYSENRYADPQVTRAKLTAYRLLDFVTQLAGVDHFHANGESVAVHYQKKLKIGARRMTVIPRGRMANPFVSDKVSREVIRREFNTSGRLLFINMARHEYQKGQDILLDALGHLSLSIRNQLQLVIVGREGKLTSMLEEKIASFDLQGTFMMTGHRNDANALLAAADVFVFPSRFEGLPGALIEAEAAGLPIICTDIPNNREVATEGNAVFFPVNDSKMLSEAIQELISNSTRREQMKEQSLNQFKEKFQSENIHLRMEKLLTSLVTSSMKGTSF